MNDRRLEPRMLCADLVQVEWTQDGRWRRDVANLEDISLSGACLQLDSPVPVNSEIHIFCPSGELVGEVRYCLFQEVGYFLGVHFSDGCHWSTRDYKPQHLLDPRRLLSRTLRRFGAGQSDGL